MSGKSLFKKFNLKGKAKGPRSLEEITKEYNVLRAKAADAQYNAYIYTLETENLNKMMLQLNSEAAERQKLDADAKAKAASESKQEVSNG